MAKSATKPTALLIDCLRSIRDSAQHCEAFPESTFTDVQARNPYRSVYTVTSPCPGYANHQFRATDGKGTSTLKIRSLVGCSTSLPWLLFMRHHSQSCVVGKPIPVYK